jgi:hypothetical protein
MLDSYIWRLSRKHNGMSSLLIQNTHFMFNNFFFPQIGSSLYESNVKKSGSDRQATDGNITRCRKDAICTPDNSTATMVTRTRLNVKLYMHCLVTHSTVF